MNDSLAVLSRTDVTDMVSFARFAQQRLGIPMPAKNQFPILGAQIKRVTDEYPHADWQTFCRVVEWALAKRRRYAHVHQLVGAFRYAWRDGYLPELDPGDPVDDLLEQRIESALSFETDSEWRHRFLRAQSMEGRRSVYEEWAKTRS